MKFESRKLNSIILFMVLISSSWAVAASVPLTFSAYFRAATGSNLNGGQSECYKNKGTFGNEFRLGNECEIYSEATFTSQLIDPETANGLSSKATFMFAFIYDNKTDFEVTTTNWVLRQAFVEIGAENDLPGKFWIGKRYYRWNDVHSDDFFPVEFNGPGAGWGGYKSSWGTWDVGVIQNSESKEINSPTTPAPTISTKTNLAAKTTVHVRLDDLEVNDKNKFSFWFILASTPATTQTTSPFQKYKTGSGSFLAAKEIYTNEEYINEFGLAYGNGVLSSMSAQGDLVKDCTTSSDASCTVKNSNRVRVWEALTLQKQKWSGQVAAVYDEYDKNTDSNEKVRWTSLSFQPVYYFTDRIQLISVLGYSNVLDESDGLGNRTLTRFTVGPQLGIGKGYYSRPVLRALYTNTAWSSNNRVSALGKSAATKRDAQSLMAQVEVWF